MRYSKPSEMKKSITIQIPEPCHEDWQKMTSTEKGKFCHVCTKEVIDFTATTDEDLVKILSKSKNTCGRFKKTQLNREVKLERKSGLNLAPYAASLLLPLSLLSTSEINADTREVSEKPYSSLGIGKFSNTNRALFKVSGVIKDENGNPLANVEITSSELHKITRSDSDGNYTIMAMNKELLVFQKDTYQTHEVRMGNASELRNITMYLVVIEHMIIGKIAPPPTEIVETITGDVVETSQIKTTIEEKNNKTSTVKITGTITDESGLPLPGVNIIVKGTTISTQSNFDGDYQIDAEVGQVLTFSYVGFVSKEITLSNISNNITLKMAEEWLGEVVVTGGLSWNDYNSSYVEPRDREAEKTAYKNEIEYARIKKARKKAERKLKRSQKKE